LDKHFKKVFKFSKKKQTGQQTTKLQYMGASDDQSVGHLSVPKGEFTFGKFESPTHASAGGAAGAAPGHQPWTIGANVEMREDFGDNGQPVKLKHKSLMKEIAAIQSRHEKLESGELNAKLAEKLHKKRQLRRKIRHAAKRLASKIAKGRAPRSSRISIKHIVKATTHQSARTVLSPLRTRHFERLKPLPKSTAMPQRLKPRSTKQALHTGSDSSASSSLALRNRALRMQLKDRRLELARMERRMSALHKAVHMEQQRLKTLKRRSILKNVDAVAKAIGGVRLFHAQTESCKLLLSTQLNH
jgi:hypothetical protein